MNRQHMRLRWSLRSRRSRTSCKTLVTVRALTWESDCFRNTSVPSLAVSSLTTNEQWRRTKHPTLWLSSDSEGSAVDIKLGQEFEFDWSNCLVETIVFVLRLLSLFVGSWVWALVWRWSVERLIIIWLYNMIMIFHMRCSKIVVYSTIFEMVVWWGTLQY